MPSLSPPRVEPRLLLGILFILVSGMLFPVMSGMAKILGPDYNSIQISWVRALNYAPANLVSPFQYFQLLGSVVVGYVLFQALPDAMTWLGAATIVASGLYVGWSQSRRIA